MRLPSSSPQSQAARGSKRLHGYFFLYKNNIPIDRSRCPITRVVRSVKLAFRYGDGSGEEEVLKKGSIDFGFKMHRNARITVMNYFCNVTPNTGCQIYQMDEISNEYKYILCISFHSMGYNLLRADSATFFKYQYKQTLNTYKIAEQRLTRQRW